MFTVVLGLPFCIIRTFGLSIDALMKKGLKHDLGVNRQTVADGFVLSIDALMKKGLKPVRMRSANDGRAPIRFQLMP